MAKTCCDKEHEWCLEWKGQDNKSQKTDEAKSICMASLIDVVGDDEVILELSITLTVAPGLGYMLHL